MMPYTKTFRVITLNGAEHSFSLEVWSSDYIDNNIRTELSTTIPEQDRIRIYLQTSLPLNQNRINTNNLVNSNEYSGPVENLAIKLYRQEYNLGNDRWDGVLLPQDVRNVQSSLNPDGFTEFQCSQWTEQGIIDVFPIQSYLSNDGGVSKHIPFWNNTNYRIDINFNDLLDTYTIYTDDSMEFMGVYDNAQNYIVGDYVKLYDDPEVSKTPWNGIQSYVTGNYVTYNGLLYLALQDSYNRNPEQETLYWKPAGSFYRCVHATTDWNPTRLYLKGEIVTYLSTKYKCLQDSVNNQPDISSAFWEAQEVSQPYHLTIEDTFFWERSNRDVLSFQFLTNELPVSVLTQHDNFSPFANNPIFKLNHMKWMSDIQEIFNNNSIFDYKFTPVKLSSDKTYVSETDSLNNEVTLRFDISSKLQKLYMNQYIPDYVPYFASLESEKEWNESLNTELLRDSKVSILKHSNLVNSFVKGLEKGIKEIYGLYCRILGSYTFVIEKSPIHPNHVYRITSTLPKLYWINHVKPVVHPLGWYEEYKEISLNVRLPIVDVPPPIDPYDPYTLNNRHYFYKFKSLILQLRSRGASYLTNNSKPPFNRDTRFYDLIAIDDMNSFYNFNWKYNSYELPQNAYNTQELYDEVENPDLFKVHITDTGNVLTFRAEYRKTGIATQYVWEVWHNGRLGQTLESYRNFYNSNISKEWFGDDIEVRVRLKNDSIIINSNTQDKFSYLLTKTVTLNNDNLNAWI